MGLSLNPLKKVWDQINPLDNARTFQNSQGNGQQQSVFQQATHNAVANAIAPAVDMGKGLVQGVSHLSTSPIELLRAATGVVTNNDAAKNAALHRAGTGAEFVKNLAQGVPRAAYQLGESVNPFGGDVYKREHTFTGLPSLVFGNAPVPTMQKQFKDTSKEKGKGYAAGEATLTALMDALGDKSAAEKGIGLGKTIQGKIAPAAEEATAAAVVRSAPKRIPVKYVKSSDKIVKPKSGVPDNLQMLNIKIARVKDPARKAELVAERDTNFPNRAQVNLKAPSNIVEAKGDPNAFNRAWQSARGVISQFGEGGKEIAGRLQKQRDASEVGQEAFVEKIPAVLDLSKKDFQKFVDTLDALDKGQAGTTSNTPSNIAQAVQQWQQAIPEIRDRAVSTGIDVGDLGPNYFPHSFKDLESVTGRKQLAQRMVDGGEANTVGEAIGKIRLMQKDYTRTFGNLEKNRTTNIGGYEKTHEALLNYISRSFDRITKAEQFGGKNEALNELMAHVESEGYNVAKGSTFDKTLRTAIGDTDYSTAAHKVSRAIRSVNAYRSLSTASVTNASQLVNTATVGGIFRTLRGVTKALVSKDERAGARQAGVLLDHTINDLAKQGLGANSKIAQNIASPLFRTVEKFNRTATAIVGKDWGNDLARRASNGSEAAMNVLRDKLGVTGKIGERLTRDQEIQASRRLVEETQFKVDPQDLPAWVDSPTGKVVAQFRTFGYKQTGFVYNQVVREALRGNFLPLTRFVLTGAPVGVATAAIKGAIKGNQPYTSQDFSKKDITKTLVGGFVNVGGGGLPVSETKNLVQSAQYGSTLSGLAGTIGGPTGSGIAETATNIDKARQGNTTPLKKEAVRNIPAVGSSIANRVYPSKATASSDKYFAALDEAHKQIKGDKKATAALNDYLARSKNPSNGKTIQLSPAESIDNSRSLFANDKLRKTVTAFEKNANSKHDPMWDLSDGELKKFLQYKAQYTGDSAKSYFHDQADMPDGSNWIDDLKKKQDAYFSALPGGGKGSEANPQTPKYPSFDEDTNTIMSTYNAANQEDKSKLMSAYGDVISNYFDSVAQWTNKMRRAEGAPEKDDYPQQTPEVKSIMDTYYSIPANDGPNGKSVSRSAWITSHPDQYKQMQDYLGQTSLYTLINEASKAQYKGAEPSQKLLKAIKNMGQYDIATYKDANGNTVYGINPQDAYAQSGSGSYQKGKYEFANTEKFRVTSPTKSSFRKSKISVKSGGKASVKAKIASGQPVMNKKVALSKSRV